MLRKDRPAAMACCFGQPMAPTEEELVSLLEHRNYIGMMAERNGQLPGWMVYGLHPGRLSLELLFVRPDCQRQRVGTALVDKLKSKLGNDRRRIVCSVPEDNLPALKFFRRQGFRCHSIDRNGAADGLDSFQMVFELQDRPQTRSQTVTRSWSREEVKA
jgi:ribosomal protein S18 acetylase RimI-like enzyme